MGRLSGFPEVRELITGRHMKLHSVLVTIMRPVFSYKSDFSGQPVSFSQTDLVVSKYNYLRSEEGGKVFLLSLPN